MMTAPNSSLVEQPIIDTNAAVDSEFYGHSSHDATPCVAPLATSCTSCTHPPAWCRGVPLVDLRTGRSMGYAVLCSRCADLVRYDDVPAA